MKTINKLRTGLMLLILAVAALSAGTVRSQNEAESSRLNFQGTAAMEDWDMVTARRISRQLFDLADAAPDNQALEQQARIFKGRLCFYETDYACASHEFDEAAKLGAFSDHLKEFQTRVDHLAKLWGGAQRVEGKHFNVRFVNPRDEVLTGPALETLERTWTVLTKEIGVVPDESIPVEIYPTFDDFSAATGLSLEDLENSGTIAVCKYRRLMINSPRILMRGYDYRDTVSHEFVHFLIYQRFQEAVPIWLHEGIAKSLEERWRSDAAVGELAPSQQSLLPSALRMNELITFDRMHPSFAKLKTPRQGQLAFAEVTTAVRWMVHKGGWPLVFKLCEELKKDPDYRQAVERATGMSFDHFWSAWTGYAKSLDYKELPGMEISVYEIRKDDDTPDDDEVDQEDLNEGVEWKYVRLGDLLRDRGHLMPAIVEYEKAREIAPYNPRILNKLGHSYIMAEQYEKSLDPLTMAVKMSPGYSTSFVNLGRSYFELKRFPEAKQALGKALDINPFNPIPYKLLAMICAEEGDRERLGQLQKNFKIVTGQVLVVSPSETADAPDLETGSTNSVPEEK